MLYSGWQKEDLWHGLIGVLFFPFFFMIVLILKDFLRTTLIVVCDKGIARYTFNYALKICQSEFLDFKEATHCTQEEGFVDPHSPVNKKGYRIATTYGLKERKNAFASAISKKMKRLVRTLTKKQRKKQEKRMSSFVLEAT